MSKITQWFKAYLNKRMLVIFMLGFSSGLPLALAGGTLQAWFKTSGASIVLIGFMTLIGQPYSYKFLWAPILDRFVPTTMLDKRRSWMLCTQLIITGLIVVMALFNPAASIKLLSFELPVLLLLGLLLSFSSATQDIAIDAYRVEILKHDERGLGSALAIEGYRLAMIASGGFALVIAGKYGWQATYLFMAGLMSIGILATLLAPGVASAQIDQKQGLYSIVLTSFKEFLTRDKAILILLLVIIYKLGDSFSHALSSTFLLDLDFTLQEVGMINKMLGVIATLVGVLVGGLFMTRVGLFKALLTFGALSGITNLTYMLLAIAGKNMDIACAAVFIENICAGMGTAAFVALIMSLCNPAYTATQFALLSSLSAFGRIYVGPVSGYMVASIGWAWFYCFSALIAIPGLLLLMYLRPQIDKSDKEEISLPAEEKYATNIKPQPISTKI